jgi:hypothetical protein
VKCLPLAAAESLKGSAKGIQQRSDSQHNYHTT